MTALARDHIANARRNNTAAGGQVDGVKNDAVEGHRITEEIKELLGRLQGVLETAKQKAVGADDSGVGMQSDLMAAQETVDLTELENAYQLSQHIRDTADGLAGVAEESLTKLAQVEEALQEISDSCNVLATNGEDAFSSSGQAEENLRQAEERLTS